MNDLTIPESAASTQVRAVPASRPCVATADLTHGRSVENNFNVLRVVLALLVIFSHSYPVSGIVAGEPLELLSRGQASFGSVAVDSFFMISGYLITQSWLRRRGFIDYLRKRMLRIYPGYAVVSFFCVFIVGPLAVSDTRKYLGQIDVVRFVLKVLALRLPPRRESSTGNPWGDLVDGPLWTVAYSHFLSRSGGCRLSRHITFSMACRRDPVSGDGHDRDSLPDPSFRHRGDRAHDPLHFGFLRGRLHLPLRNEFRASRMIVVVPWSPWFALSLPLPGLPWRLRSAVPTCFLRCFQPDRVAWSVWPKHRPLPYGLYLYAWPVQQWIVWQTGREIRSDPAVRDRYRAHHSPCLVELDLCRETFSLFWRK